MVDDLEEAFVEAGCAHLVYDVLTGCGVVAVERCGSFGISGCGLKWQCKGGLGDSRAKSIIGGAFAFGFGFAILECI